VCTTWGKKEKNLYLLHVLRRRMEYPDLKRAVREQADVFKPNTILIENKSSGAQLIQELVREGMHSVRKYDPRERDKVMRLYPVSSMIENGFVFLPDQAPWRAEYLHEIASFPNGRHDDQCDSTSQALDWIKNGSADGFFNYLINNDLARKRAKESGAQGESCPQLSKPGHLRHRTAKPVPELWEPVGSEQNQLLLVSHTSPDPFRPWKAPQSLVCYLLH
jgi:predicted phage terminase large subunit-like protein